MCKLQNLNPIFLFEYHRLLQHSDLFIDSINNTAVEFF